MKATRFSGIDDAKSRIGQEIGISDWLVIDQARVNGFADVTGDQQWIHVDVERAGRESPFGGPIAHGYLTLSLLAKFAGECIAVDGIKLAVNYGLNRVRFASPVKVGSRVRARFTLGAVEDIRRRRTDALAGDDRDRRQRQAGLHSRDADPLVFLAR
jgi:acyl dehydratase